MEAGCEARAPFYCNCVRDLGIKLADQDRGSDVLHRNVSEHEVSDIVIAPIPVRFDPYPLVGALEGDAFGPDILDPSRDLTADGQAMPMQKCAVRDDDIAGR